MDNIIFFYGVLTILNTMFVIANKLENNTDAITWILNSVAALICTFLMLFYTL